MKRRRDYQRKDFRNPYFSKKEKPRIPKGLKFYLIIFFIVITVCLFFLNKGDYFQITAIDIKGTEYINNQEIENLVLEQMGKRRFWFFRQSSIIFFSKNQAKKELTAKYFFDQLKIKKIYPSKIQIEIKEKISALVWISGTEKYYLDLKGMATRKVSSADLLIKSGEGETDIVRPEIVSGKYPLIYDQSNSPVTIGQLVISPNLVDFIIGLNEELEKIADFDISHYSISQPEASEITLITKEGWEIYFKTTESVIKQVEILFSVLSQRVKDRSKLEYIDLRFGEKVFWK